MRESKRPKAMKPVRFREEGFESTDSTDKQNVENHDLPDLREKLNSKRKMDGARSRSKVNKRNENTGGELVAEMSEDQSEHNFSPDYEIEEVEQNDSNGHPDEESDNITESDESGTKGANNNAQRVKSVVIETSHTQTLKGAKRTNKRLTVSRKSETEDGELSSSDNQDKTDNLENWIEKVDDEQLTAVLKKHQERIKRLTGDFDRQNREGTGEADNLAINIRRMSMRDNPMNSRSEDTIYSQLVKQRRELEQKESELREDQGDNGPGLDQSRQINNSADSSLSSNETPNTSKSDGISTDETDKQIVLDKFVESATRKEQYKEDVDHTSSDLSDFYFSDKDDDYSPPPKRIRGNEGKRKKFTVE